MHIIILALSLCGNNSFHNGLPQNLKTLINGDQYLYVEKDELIILSIYRIQQFVANEHILKINDYGERSTVIFKVKNDFEIIVFDPRYHDNHGKDRRYHMKIKMKK